MKVLLTGSTGFLGSYLLKLLIKKGYSVIALKRSSSNMYRIANVEDKVKFYDIDKIDISEVFKENEIDLVINTVTNYGRKDTGISSIVDTNLMFGLKLLEESVNNEVKGFINTDTLLDKNINAYSLSKSQLVDWMKFFSLKNTKMINIKIEHMYGPKDDENKFIYWLINQLRLNIPSIDLTSGIQKRDFIYISDITRAYEIIIEKIDELYNFEEFELGSGRPVEVKEFINTIYDELEKQQQISTKLNFGAVPYRKNENMNMVANITKLNSLGWKAEVFIKEGIEKILNEDK